MIQTRGLYARRQDYTADVVELGLPAANYASEHKEFSGLVIPTRRRVYYRRPDGQPILDSIVVAIDFHEIRVAYQDMSAHKVKQEDLK